MRYFNGVTTDVEAKKLYRGLMFKYHPDLNSGNVKVEYTRICQDINLEYQLLLASLSGIKGTSKSGKEYTYRYNQDIEQGVADKLDELIGMRLSGIEIWLVGTWIWVEGNTYQHREVLKAAGLKWHGKRKMWFFNLDDGPRHYSKKGFDELKEVYGAFRAEGKEERALC